jgi:hypothetical protein
VSVILVDGIVNVPVYTGLSACGANCTCGPTSLSPLVGKLGDSAHVIGTRLGGPPAPTIIRNLPLVVILVFLTLAASVNVEPTVALAGQGDGVVIVTSAVRGVVTGHVTFVVQVWESTVDHRVSICRDVSYLLLFILLLRS